MPPTREEAKEEAKEKKEKGELYGKEEGVASLHEILHAPCSREKERE